MASKLVGSGRLDRRAVAAAFSPISARRRTPTVTEPRDGRGEGRKPAGRNGGSWRGLRCPAVSEWVNRPGRLTAAWARRRSSITRSNCFAVCKHPDCGSCDSQQYRMLPLRAGGFQTSRQSVPWRYCIEELSAVIDARS